MNATQGQEPTAVAMDSSAVVALVLAVVSLGGLLFPPLLGAAVIAIALGWNSRRRIKRSGGALRGRGIATAGLAVGALGALVSLVLPGFVAFVYIYAAFHGGQLPGNGLP